MAVIEQMDVEIVEKQIVFSRLISAPRELVYKAWTDPEMLKVWWGPHGFTNPECVVNWATGGVMRIIMQSPEGDKFPAKFIVMEVVENEKLVIADTIDEMPMEWIDMLNEWRGKEKGNMEFNSIVTVLFEDYENKTKLTLVNSFDTNADRDAIVKMGSTEGWGQSLQRLETFVTKS